MAPTSCSATTTSSQSPTTSAASSSLGSATAASAARSSTGTTAATRRSSREEASTVGLMKVVHSAAHRGHDPAHEVVDGEAVACYDSPARVEAIRETLWRDSAFTSVHPVEHGIGPIEAVHDAAYVAWMAGAWKDWAA